MRFTRQIENKLFFNVNFSSGNKLLAILEDYEAEMNERLEEAFCLGRQTGAMAH